LDRRPAAGRKRRGEPLKELYQRKGFNPEAYLPKTFLYSVGHCWLAVEGLAATVGVTEFLFDLAWRDFYYVALPKPGQEIVCGQTCGALDALKIAIPILAPLSGVVEEVNHEVERTAHSALMSPYSRGWLWRMEMTNPIELKKLMRIEDYRPFVQKKEAYALMDKAIY
jgi:glycine cleavage system H protein